jgi:2,3-bisphosphoglycerate-dependent phosphoglycerate mutase
MRLYLIRHAQTSWNLEGRAQGHTDIALDHHGEEQARRLALAFEGVELCQVLSSDLQRSSKTAEAIAEAAEARLELLPSLRERSFGEWEGLPYESVWAKMSAMQHEGLPREQVQPPGGESIQMVWDRLDAAVERLRTLQGPAAVVSHGGSCALLLSKLLRGNIETARAFRFGNTSVTELHLRPDGFFLMVRYNDTAHLDDLSVKAGNLEGTSR